MGSPAVLESGPKKDWPSDQIVLEIEKKWIELLEDIPRARFTVTPRQEEMVKALDDCLLEESEVLKGKAYWYSLPDPFLRVGATVTMNMNITNAGDQPRD